MLLTLLSCQRGQILHLIDIRNIHLQDSCVNIVTGDLLKTSDNKKHLVESNLSWYDEDTDLCVVNVLTHYLQRKEHLRASETKMFITTQRPNKPGLPSSDGWKPLWSKLVLMSAFSNQTDTAQELLPPAPHTISASLKILSCGYFCNELYFCL